MSASAETLCDHVKAGLSAAGGLVRNGEPNRWSVAWPGLGASCLIRHEPDWLLAGSPFTLPVEFEKLPHLLESSSQLAGFAKFTLGRDQRLAAQSELPWWPDAEVPCRALTATADGLKTALELMLGDRSLPFIAAAPVPPEILADSLRAELDGTGWNFSVRHHQFIVELEALPGHFQATVESLGAGGVRLAVALVEFPAADSHCARASACFLLSLAGHVRFVRAFLRTEGTQAVAGMEVIFPPKPSTEELALAFAGLSVACAHGGEEARTLSQPVLAQRALAVWGAETTNTNTP